MNKLVIVTGGAGFVGHHFVEHLLKNTDWNIAVFDKLSYSSSGFDRIRDINAFDNKRVFCYTIDITQEIPIGIYQETKNASAVFHFAAESHVDNSIEDPIKFIKSNVLGTGRILNFARLLNNLDCFFFMSTDEVFGPATNGVEYAEWDRYHCTNPYSATKAGAEELTLAFINTYSIPGFISHCMNIFGERQHSEKFIPMCIKKILKGEKIPIHANENLTMSGSRFYIHARNVSDAILFLYNKYENGDKYNIVGEREVTNLDLALKIGDILGKDVKYEMVNFHSSRPGHDLRYALDGRKLDYVGWKAPIDFESSLEKMVKWSIDPKNNIWIWGET